MVGVTVVVGRPLAESIEKTPISKRSIDTPNTGAKQLRVGRMRRYLALVSDFVTWDFSSHPRVMGPVSSSMVGPLGNYCESFNMSRAEQSNPLVREWVQILSLIVHPHKPMIKDTGNWFRIVFLLLSCH